jgi:hypothetical protein
MYLPSVNYKNGKGGSSLLYKMKVFTDEDKHKNVSSFCFTLQTLIVSDLLENIEKNILQKQLANLNRNFAGMICGK